MDRRNLFSQFLNVHEDNYVRQTEIQTADPLVPEPRAFEVEVVIENLKGINQFPAELIKAGSSTICSEINKRMSSIWSKNELPGQ